MAAAGHAYGMARAAPGIIMQFSKKYVLLFHSVTETSGKSQSGIKVFLQAVNKRHSQEFAVEETSSFWPTEKF